MTDERPAAGDPDAAGGARAVIDDPDAAGGARAVIDERGGPDQRGTLGASRATIDERGGPDQRGTLGASRATIDEGGGPDQRVTADEPTADEPTAGRPLSIRSAGPATPLYKGEPLDADRGPGLGCFWSQVVVLTILVVLTPIGVANAWPFWLTGGMLILTILLLLFAGQTVIFLLRLVAADRRTRRRPLRSATPTVGDLEQAEPPVPSAPSSTETDTSDRPGGSAAMRQ